MKWILIVTVLFNDGEVFTGPLTANVYTKDECRLAKQDIAITVDEKFKVLAASCVKSEAI